MFVDAHAHLDRYEQDLGRVIDEIQASGILTVSTSMNVPSYQRNVEIAASSDYVLTAFGIHPWNAGGYARSLDDLKPYIDRSPLLGEIGLDYHYVKHAHRYRDQRRVFEAFLRAAADSGKVVNLHTKGAEEDVLGFLQRYGIVRAIIHWYSGPPDILDDMIAEGYYFTVGVEVLHSESIRRIAARIPCDRLLTETDNPGALKWLKGEVGMPSVIRDVAECTADLRGLTPEAMVETVACNFRRLLADVPGLPGGFRALLERDGPCSDSPV